MPDSPMQPSHYMPVSSIHSLTIVVHNNWSVRVSVLYLEMGFNSLAHAERLAGFMVTLKFFVCLSA